MPKIGISEKAGIETGMPKVMLTKTKFHLPLFLYIIFLFSCSQESEKNEAIIAPQPESEASPGLSFLALGDSYTIGQSVTEAERWPVILARDLLQKNKIVVKSEILATTGWTTTDLLDALASRKFTKTYDMVSLMIGVNNQFQGQPAEGFRRPFSDLLAKSVVLADGKRERVFVLSIPDWGVSRYAASFDRKKIVLQIDAFNAVAKEECGKEKILFIDITEISRLALNNPSLLASDGLHFSGQMHQLWVDEVISQIK